MNLRIEERLAIAKLRDADVNKIQIQYYGGGDDGSIENIEAFDYNGDELYSEQVIFNLEKLNDKFFELLIENIEFDWINNDGGYGNAIFNLNSLEFTIEHFQRVEESFEYKEQLHGPPIIT